MVVNGTVGRALATRKAHRRRATSKKQMDRAIAPVSKSYVNHGSCATTVFIPCEEAGCEYRWCWTKHATLIVTTSARRRACNVKPAAAPLDGENGAGRRSDREMFAHR
jgi:hypothetical protein